MVTIPYELKKLLTRTPLVNDLVSDKGEVQPRRAVTPAGDSVQLNH